MNGAENATTVVTAKLPSGVPVRVEIAGSSSGDGMTSVGLRDLDLDKALDAIGEIGSVVIEKLKAAKPTRATVELKLGFAVEAGKLTALAVLEWAQQLVTERSATLAQTGHSVFQPTLRDQGIAEKTGGGRGSRFRLVRSWPPAEPPAAAESRPYTTIEALAQAVHDGLVDASDEQRAILEQAWQIANRPCLTLLQGGGSDGP